MELLRTANGLMKSIPIATEISFDIIISIIY